MIARRLIALAAIVFTTACQASLAAHSDPSDVHVARFSECLIVASQRLQAESAAAYCAQLVLSDNDRAARTAEAAAKAEAAKNPCAAWNKPLYCRNQYGYGGQPQVAGVVAQVVVPGSVPAKQ